MKAHTIVVSLVTSAALALGACGGGSSATTTTTPPPADDVATKPVASLFERLGGLPAITAVVDDFVNNVAADARINTFFANTDAAKLKALLTDQVCAATGGPCTYGGKDMRTVHTGMKITEADFNALVEDLVISLDKFKVGQTEKDELLGALGGMKGDIVGL